MNDVSFTRPVRRALQASREEAIRLFHPVVDTQHILLGILRHEESDARGLLDRLSVDPVALRHAVEERIPPGEPGGSRQSDLPWTNGAKAVLEQAMLAGHDLAHPRLGTGHLLLGLLREGRCLAARVLHEAGATPEAIIAHLPSTGSQEATEEPSGRQPVVVTIGIEHRDGTTSTETFPSAFAAVRYLFDLARDTE